MSFIIYCFIRIFGFFISLLPYSAIHALGRWSGTCAYYLHRSFRKKALANLAIAFHQSHTERERTIIAIKSFQNLMITLLEFFRFKRSEGRMSEIVTLTENNQVESLLIQKQGVVFLSAHQANWEISFLALTDRYKGIAIGRPIKNRWLYQWVLSIREMNGGKIVMPKNAIRAGLKALLRGEFLGIVGDQAYPESPYSYPFLGTRAWTASTPALLAYKTGCPLIAGSTRRINGHYFVEGSSPIWPNLNVSMKDEVPRMMDQAMQFLENSIRQQPDQWMWIHDRWKQQGIDHVKRKYRYGFILVILPREITLFSEIFPLLRAIYPRSFLTFLIPAGCSISVENSAILEYHDEKDLYVRDWRFQLVLDFYLSKKLRRHFLKLGAFQAIPLTPQSKIIKQKLIKKECLTTVSF